MKAITVVVLVLGFLSCVHSCGDLLHAHCELYWTFFDAQCTDVLSILANQFKQCCMEPTIDVNYTHYHLVSYNPSSLTVSGKLQFNDGYIDDQTITLTQNGTNCSGYGCSHSESLSYYDYDANYCDIHNLVRDIGYDFNETMGECRFHPDVGDEDSYCNHQ